MVKRQYTQGVRILLCVLIVAAGPAHTTASATNSAASTAKECSIKSIELEDRTDADGDGLYSQATFVVTLDTQCYGVYDGSGLLGDPHIEPTLQAKIDGEKLGGSVGGWFVKVKDIVGEENAIDANVRVTLEAAQLFDEVNIGPGTHTVTIELWDDDSTYTAFTVADADFIGKKTVTVGYEPESADVNEDPTARFEYAPNSVQTGQTITFDASQSSDPETQIQSFKWDLDGDGSIEKRGEQVNHVFDSSGTVSVTLTVVDGAGVADTLQKEVFVSVGDTDNDGLDDDREQSLGTDPTNADTDNDGLDDGAEVNQYNTDPTDPDTDDDGLNDGAEVNQYNSNPTNSDTDGDGLDDGTEVTEHRTDPTESDTDDDGLPDLVEVQEYNTDPTNADTDNDGLDDGAEVNQYNTDPTDPDTDDDGAADGVDPAPNDPSVTETKTITDTMETTESAEDDTISIFTPGFGPTSVLSALLLITLLAHRLT